MISEADIQLPVARSKAGTVCYHCGEECLTNKIHIEDKYFCCDGCRLVYEIINENGLCDYYALQSHPGLSRIKSVRSDKYAFLDDKTIAEKLYQFTNGDLTITTLYIPSIHCSSCLWLLEHLGRLDPGITEGRVNFAAKEVTIHFSLKETSFRKVVELLATIGYEPYISLDDTNKKTARSYNKQRIIKLGIAGFCFGNIMMMSFPEYLSGNGGIENQYAYLFRYLNLLLSLPVFFYSATEFYSSAWAGLKQRMLNIDAPIVLALIITFARSIYEILTGTGAGYLDSMAGIVFFMLAGRILQERTYKSLSFTRDYKAYFPIAVSVKTGNSTEMRQLQDLREKDVVVLHNDEIVPADSIVLNEEAMIDYSFVTGEAEPVYVKRNNVVYAGGRSKGKELLVEVVKPIAGSYLTSLWNHYAFKKNKRESNENRSVVHILSKYFTVILFSLALITAVWWGYKDPSKIISSVSAMLIVACPCALLLSATFTNSNILRVFGANGLYLRDATVIEQMAGIDHIVFDKTGTITQGDSNEVLWSGDKLTDGEKDMLFAAVRQSNHPNSKALAQWLGERTEVPVISLKETPGMGVEARIGTILVMVGSATFTNAAIGDENFKPATVYARIGDNVTCFYLHSDIRDAMPELIKKLRSKYAMSLLSGDNDRQRPVLTELFGKGARLIFEQKPEDKLNYVEGLQNGGKKVMMIGDGLNDAGALQQSNVGITLADDVNNFTPACDGILDARRLRLFPALNDLAKLSGAVIKASFVISILYNIAGLYFAMQGLMKPVVAAILMPCSTLSIVIISSGLTNLIAWKKGLSVKSV